MEDECYPICFSAHLKFLTIKVRGSHFEFGLAVPRLSHGEAERPLMKVGGRLWSQSVQWAMRCLPKVLAMVHESSGDLQHTAEGNCSVPSWSSWLITAKSRNGPRLET